MISLLLLGFFPNSGRKSFLRWVFCPKKLREARSWLVITSTLGELGSLSPTTVSELLSSTTPHLSLYLLLLSRESHVLSNSLISSLILVTGIYIGERRVVHFVPTNTIGSSSSIGSIVWCSSRLTSTSISDPSICPEFLDCGFRQPESGVVLSCLDCFLAGDSLYRFEYGVPIHHVLFKLRGCTCTTAKADPPELVNNRALHLLRHGFLDYDTLSNNCEHFSMYCKTGLLCIGGGLIGQASALNTPVIATGTCAVLKWLIQGALIVKATAAGFTHLTSRYRDDLGVRSERPQVVKVPVEVLSTFCASGTSGRSSFREGKKTSYDKPAATSFSATGKTMIRHPEVKWAQRLDKVYITVLLSDAKQVEVNLEPDGRFTFSAIAGVENHFYGVKLTSMTKLISREAK
ncbi:hypothetical protein RHGRI_019833 [Rhododendron griersonianum]|uniref:LRAT domain-containing protein n=1 Tax=Rhododendron griersonianum TaxID=479676 RepID=A0AAV6JH67_9ERIC|nr:hypothetical protein RHGRI_019833 [Rhododendron griersonianum]